MGRKRARRGWGEGQVYPTASGTWGIRWREGGRYIRRSGFASKDDAERVLDVVRGRVALDGAGMPRPVADAPRLADAAEDFLARRDRTHRCAALDRLRWKLHLRPDLGHLRPGEVDAGTVRRFIEGRLRAGLNPATVRILVSILSGLFEHLMEERVATSNPCKGLPRSTRRLMKPTHDPRTTPFIEKLSDVRRIYLALPEPLSIAYAIGALAGLRTGEVFALRWAHVDLAARRIHVRESVTGPLKDKDSRVVPILDPLLPVLAEWKLRTKGLGRVIPPLRRDGAKVDKHTPGNYLRPVLKALGLTQPGLGWYEATRHTFASHWVLAGGSIEKLSKVLGHYSVVMTERYAHLRPDLFPESDLGTITLDLRPGAAETGALEPRTSRGPEAPSATSRPQRENAGAAL
jgi:integrase